MAHLFRVHRRADVGSLIREARVELADLSAIGQSHPHLSLFRAEQTEDVFRIDLGDADGFLGSGVDLVQRAFPTGAEQQQFSAGSSIIE